MNIIIIGAGGHAKVVIEVFRALGTFRLLGLVDPAAQSETVLGLPVLGGDAILPELRRQGIEAAFVALGANRARQRIGADLAAMGFALPTAIHPASFVSPSALLGAGIVVMARAVLGTQTAVRDMAIINTGAVVDHDNLIAAAAHVAPGCALAGGVQVGERSLVGVGSAVRPGIRIGADVTIGAGSAVVADVRDGAWVGGAPARALRASNA